MKVVDSMAPLQSTALTLAGPKDGNSVARHGKFVETLEIGLYAGA
ncbi:hypothetical protein WM2015_1250 [Wenzhouxiangella marina]|uniref:Uncharacterized protein n=1 Tax=Wenzhouxiangella marina TaxID=1579979 RepID=A0A0K0XV85_9GAMM|nr:hypothetical protein WM2015_1250 [Wenzhouxiangella marina]